MPSRCPCWPPHIHVPVRAPAAAVATILLGSCCTGALGAGLDRTVQNDGVACAVALPSTSTRPPIQDRFDDNNGTASLWTAYAGWIVGVVLVWAACALVVHALASADAARKKAPKEMGPLRRLWSRIPLPAKAPVVLFVVSCIVLPHFVAEVWPLAMTIVGLVCRVVAIVVRHACLVAGRMVLHGQRCAALALVNIAMRAVPLAAVLVDLVL
nr:hypothetical protein [Pandoravirus belohorizontensis]